MFYRIIKAIKDLMGVTRNLYYDETRLKKLIDITNERAILKTYHNEHIKDIMAIRRMHHKYGCICYHIALLSIRSSNKTSIEIRFHILNGEAMRGDRETEG